jgi:hypothetical protein
MTNPDSVKLFYSYSHRDEQFRVQLEAHLSTLRRQNRIEEWHDRKIVPGQEWQGVIDDRLEGSKVILLLVSADFIDSDYCYETEMQRAVEKHERGEAIVVPVIIRPADWQETPFGRIQAIPKDGKPVTLWANQDEAWLDVVGGIRRVLTQLTTTSYSLPPSETEDAHLRILWNVPYRHNPFFTGREHVLERLRSTLASKGRHSVQPQAISGLGGIGKTQLATEYAYRYREDYEMVLWAEADSQEILISSLTSIAQLCNIPFRDPEDPNDKRPDAVTAVKGWLAANTGWLLIFDNANDLTMAQNFLPTHGSGHILFTTQAQATGAVAQNFGLEALEPEQGALLLLRRAKFIQEDAPAEDARDDHYAQAIEISREMSGLPLALDQAGAFIEETSSTLTQYLHLYREEGARLRAERGDYSVEHPESVAVTFSLSFENVEAVNPAAADLLRICAFLDPNAIPEEILIEGASALGETLGAAAAAPIELAQAIKDVGRYSLLRREPEARTLTMHRLVQAVLKDEMDEMTLHVWAGRAVLATNHAFGSAKGTEQPYLYRDQPHLERLIPQVLACAELIHDLKKLDFEADEGAQLLHEGGHYLYQRGAVAAAELLLKQALQLRLEKVGRYHPSTTAVLHTLGAVYRAQGRVPMILWNQPSGQR